LTASVQNQKTKAKTSLRPYKIYEMSDGATTAETHGECWSGETVLENIELCQFQTILPGFLKHLPRHGRILESGCGLGRWVFYLRRKGFDVTGIDLARSAVEMAKAFDPSIPILLDDALHSQFPPGTFDAVISLGVVEHFEEGPQAAFTEIRRVLKDGGTLFISVPVQGLFRLFFTNRLKDLYRWYRKRKGIRFVFEEYRFNRNDFQKRLEAARFEVLDVVPDDFLPPKNLGLYADLTFLHHKNKKWELNAFGNALASVLRSISPWMQCAGAHWVCRKLPD
jgi:SAM-dependent methyltransferase